MQQRFASCFGSNGASPGPVISRPARYIPFDARPTVQRSQQSLLFSVASTSGSHLCSATRRDLSTAAAAVAERIPASEGIMKIVDVPLGDRSYPIYIGQGLLDRGELLQRHIPGKRVLIVTNETIAPLYLERCVLPSLQQGLPCFPHAYQTSYPTPGILMPAAWAVVFECRAHHHEFLLEPGVEQPWKLLTAVCKLRRWFYQMVSSTRPWMC